MYSSVLVLDDQKEQQIGWGRGYSATGQPIDQSIPLQPNEIVLSSTIASSLNLRDGDRVYVKLNLPPTFFTILKGEEEEVEEKEDMKAYS